MKNTCATLVLAGLIAVASVGCAAGRDESTVGKFGQDSKAADLCVSRCAGVDGYDKDSAASKMCASNCANLLVK